MLAVAVVALLRIASSISRLCRSLYRSFEHAQSAVPFLVGSSFKWRAQMREAALLVAIKNP